MKTILKSAVLCSLLHLLCSTAICWSATYYVDADNGSENNNGLSPASAWKTIAKVNNSQFLPGDNILFKRGETWREQLTVSSSGSPGDPITFGAYGAGNKPKILGSVNLSGSSISDDVGNLIFNNESSCGRKESSLNSLGLQGDFYYDPATGYLYVYSTSNPGSYYTAIEDALRTSYNSVVYIAKDYVTIRGLDIRYGDYHGFKIDRYHVCVSFDGSATQTTTWVSTQMVDHSVIRQIEPQRHLQMLIT